jgi:hypothetical protein
MHIALISPGSLQIIQIHAVDSTFNLRQTGHSYNPCHVTHIDSAVASLYAIFQYHRVLHLLIVVVVKRNRFSHYTTTANSEQLLQHDIEILC